MPWHADDRQDAHPFRCDHPRRGRRRADVRRRRRAARPAGAADRSCRPGREEDPDLGRRTLQLHQPPHRARSLPLRQPAFRQIRARPLPAGRFRRPGRSPRHRLAREDARPALLRRLGQPDRQLLLDECAKGSVDLARQGDRGGRSCRRAFPRALRRRAWRRPRTGDRHRRPSIPKIGATGFAYDSPGGSASSSSSRAPHWCR